MEYVRENRKLIEDLQPSFFEMTVDMAFMHFAEEKVDIAVIETGMGGRLDSTNIITPVLGIITNIGLDHTRFLGGTIEKIAIEKAGIIKRNVPVVIGESHPDSGPVFIDKAGDMGSEIVFADKEIRHDFFMMQMDRKVSGSFQSAKAVYRDLICDLSGSYQKKNIITAIRAIEIVSERETGVSTDSIYSGFSQVKKLTGLRGRWEEISYNPLVICDTAHNPDGIKEVVSQIKNTPYKNLHIIWGMVNDKDTLAILNLLPKNATYYFTRADIPRSLDETELMQFGLSTGLKGKAWSGVETAYGKALSEAEKEDLIFVGGSSFVVGDLLEFLGR